MNEVAGRTHGSGRTLLASCFVSVLTAAVVAFVCAATAASAGQPQRTFQAAHPPQVTGTAVDGTRVTIGVQVVSAELSPVSPAAPDVSAPVGELFLVVELHADESAGPPRASTGLTPCPSTTCRSGSGPMRSPRSRVPRRLRF